MGVLIYVCVKYVCVPLYVYSVCGVYSTYSYHVLPVFEDVCAEFVACGWLNSVLYVYKYTAYIQTHTALVK